MKKRTFLIDTSGGAGNALVKVLQHYIDAAYPKGGSDCAAASREALLSLANEIESTENASYCEISTRQRPILNAAVNWYFKESGIEADNESTQAEFELLSSLLIKKR